jgi:aerobic-type carbon monoxide dehydrogenase small subunit (CoxS/CutS family)
MYACHLLAIQARGRKIVTIEGLAEREGLSAARARLSPTMPGNVGSAPRDSPSPHMRRCSGFRSRCATAALGVVGHICRCNAYENIVAAVCEAGRRR